MQGVIKSYDPVSGGGLLITDGAGLPEYELAANALEGSVFRMLRQGQRVVFDLDEDGRARAAAPRERGRHGHAWLPSDRVRVDAPHISVASPEHQGAATMPATTTNDRLRAWVDEWAAVLEPDAIHWCDGSREEYDRLAGELVAAGTFTRLDEAKRPNSYWAHSDPGDVARVEDRTFICSATQEAAGPNNNWRQPDEMRPSSPRSTGGR